MGEWRYSSTILDLGIIWRWVVSFTLLPLYLRGKSPRYTLDWRPGGPQSRPGRCGGGGKSRSIGNRTRAVQPVLCIICISYCRSQWSSASVWKITENNIGDVRKRPNPFNKFMTLQGYCCSYTPCVFRLCRCQQNAQRIWSSPLNEIGILGCVWNI
jgi:hypothetical protein